MQTISLIGAFLILLPFTLSQLNRLAVRSVPYQLMNLLGSEEVHELVGHASHGQAIQLAQRERQEDEEGADEGDGLHGRSRGQGVEGSRLRSEC
jgi:hypothetical protein